MADYEMTLMDRQRIARGTIACCLDTNGAEYEFQAGQHADFAFLHPINLDGDNCRTFSIANSPRDRDLVMVALRMRKTPFKVALKTAGLGTKFKVSRPRGSFALHKDVTRPAVFLAGGIGITPIRSMIHWATQERLPHKIYLFYSNRGAEDAAFLEDFEGMAAQNRSFTLIPTLTRCKSPSWPYESGPIDRNLLRCYLRGLNGPVYYVAGPSGMVSAMTALLQSSGVSNDDIKTEEFGDYKQDSLLKPSVFV